MTSSTAVVARILDTGTTWAGRGAVTANMANITTAVARLRGRVANIGAVTSQVSVLPAGVARAVIFKTIGAITPQVVGGAAGMTHLLLRLFAVSGQMSSLRAVVAHTVFDVLWALTLHMSSGVAQVAHLLALQDGTVLTQVTSLATVMTGAHILRRCSLYFLLGAIPTQVPGVSATMARTVLTVALRAVPLQVIGTTTSVA